MEPQVINLSDLCKFTPKQLAATKAADEHIYTLFGGAAGPGKSYWLRWYPIRKLIQWGKQFSLTGIRGALFSEDFPTLKDRQISKMEVEFPKWLGEIKDTKTHGLGFHLRPEFGSHVLSLKNLDDPSKYLSSEFAIIAVEELTMNPEDKFHKLRSRLRWTGIPNPKFIAATNPGQQGHGWVKKRWIDRDFPEEEKDISEQFVYVPALPTDNPYLAASYLKTLASLAPKLRKAYLEGNWDVFEGQYFSEWDQNTHTCDPFPIPDTWKKIRTIDHGRTAPTAGLWGAVDHDGRIWWYREYYKAGEDADVNAKEIARLSEGETYWATVMDSACYSKNGYGETIADIYRNNGVYADPWPKNRLAGWALFHEYLRHTPEEKPRMVFFKTCSNAIREIPLAIHDDIRPEDIDTDGSDHALDAVRGALEYLSEQKSPKPRDPVEEMLHKMKQKSTVNPMNLNKFYSRR